MINQKARGLLFIPLYTLKLIEVDKGQLNF